MKCRKCNELTYRTPLKNKDEFHICLNKNCELYNVVLLADQDVNLVPRKEFLKTKLIITPTNRVKVFNEHHKDEDERHNDISVSINNKNEFDILSDNIKRINWDIGYKDYQSFHNDIMSYHSRFEINFREDPAFLISFKSGGGKGSDCDYVINVIEAVRIIDYIKQNHSDRFGNIIFKTK